MTTQPDHPNPADRPQGPERPDPNTSDALPMCYRHPDRETYVRCQRCDRSICPDCMRAAAVGHQCPECVRDGNKTVRRAEAAFGGRPVTTPVVTWALLAINVLAYLGEVINAPAVLDRFMMSADHVAAGEWWRLFTSAFLHAEPPSYWHILFNMWALFAIGPQLEKILGSLRFAAVYLLSALGGSMAVYLFGSYAVGASGAIYGLFGAMFVISRRMGYDVRGVLWLIGINVVLTFVVPGISWQGHLGGLVAGAVVTALFAYAPARSRKAFQLATVAGMLVVYLAILMAVPPLAA
ncbi:rhomboid family intramembrane serine protease [Sphaerisporangium krabiense]|uniref:Membrane associated rhomboid family serine protease n=1 Tax=Sphaerisporangium krabiense TaxID=763782 RepID=A0A7W8Z334_9ACTN|nr:rhomboid family intramembrane serine protease [Sphaerisporangium krabiense]MBB5626509.1 membrane associated rhomboid family serine protease [Sphaerisporangium krabiense]GII63430.1 rhomboid family intramembrane serine protease [Sphaerisporangium krabiense]